MKVTVAKDLQAFYSMAAWRLVSQIVDKPNSMLGLATGRTTTGIHAALAEIYAAHPFDISRLCVFGMDEIINVDRSYFGSCYDIILREVVQPLGIAMENFFMPMTYADDFQRECRAFEAVIAARGGIDFQVLGIGENGHIGFNQPGTPFHSRTMIGKMDERLEARVRQEVGASPDSEMAGLTLGIVNVMHSRKILLVANGKNKAAIVREALPGPITEAVPSSVLQLHPFLEVILDPEAAGELDLSLL